QSAMDAALTLPAVSKRPPATRSPLARTARALTDGVPFPDTPAPRLDHAVPFQRATRLADVPPAVVNVPPATTSPLGRAASALTPPGMPEPMASHAPFQRAMLVTSVPPALVNVPAAMMSPLGMTSTALMIGCVPARPVPM